ncbi:hypothetical protein BH24ACT5_BH24ACT5_06450 [soil metagenome]
MNRPVAPATDPETVTVNLLWCRPGQVGGSEEYLVRQLLGLHGVAPHIDVTVVAPPGFAAAHDDLASRMTIRTGPGVPGGRPGRVAAEATWLARATRASALVHHGGGTVPAVPRRRSARRAPIVLTVHDLQYLEFPEFFSTTRRRYLAGRMPRSVRRADIVTVPSVFVRSTVIDHLGVEPGRVMVVPHGVPAPPTDPESDPNGNAVAVRTRYGLGGRPFVVFPAITHPHKGHDFLLRVLAGPWRADDVQLVLLGGAGRADADVTAAIIDQGLADRVVRPGRVPAADRDALIAAAEALVFPSEYEGFGAPVVEAMVLGTPVICSDQAAVPEVAGDAGLVLPLDVDAWARALDRVRADRAAFAERGRNRASHFTLEVSGRALAAAYRRAVAAAGSSS